MRQLVPMLVGGVLGLAAGVVATLWSLPGEPLASSPATQADKTAENDGPATITIRTDGERNPFIGLRDDQIALERQIRTVVPTDDGPYKLMVLEGAARMLVGLGFRDTNASEVVLTVRDVTTGRPIVERALVNDGSGKWQDVRNDLTQVGAEHDSRPFS